MVRNTEITISASKNILLPFVFAKFNNILPKKIDAHFWGKVCLGLSHIFHGKVSIGSILKLVGNGSSKQYYEYDVTSIL